MTRKIEMRQVNRLASRIGVLNLAFCMTSLLLILIVALATPYRSEHLLADAWEHHRVVRVLSELGNDPGNPTYLTPEPSIRYSPYSMALAIASRVMKIDAYDILSLAAVMNTAMCFVGLYLLLRGFGRQVIALPTLFAMVLLYGEAPGYANSLALSDLPWHQVNPSAAALVICLLAWVMWQGARNSVRRMAWVWPMCVVLITTALLNHGMTAVIGGIGLVSIGLTNTGAKRWRLLAAAAALALAVFLLGITWPMYDLHAAMRQRPDPWYWYNPTIVRLMLTQWCLPCYLMALLALPYRRDAVVRFGLWGMLMVAVLTAFSVATRSATFARLPLAGMIFPQILVGYVAWRRGLLRAKGWKDAILGLCSPHRDRFNRCATTLLLPFLLLFWGLPQVADLLREPHLLRSPIARMIGRENKQPRYFSRYTQALKDIQEHDVVLAEPHVGWPVPSFAGRVVAAAHLEYFVPHQQQRLEDVAAFFSSTTSDAQRIRLLRKYNVSWILLDTTNPQDVTAQLVEPSAIHYAEPGVGGLVLMDATGWTDRRAAAGSSSANQVVR